MWLDENKYIPKAFALHYTFDLTLHFKQHRTVPSTEKIPLCSAKILFSLLVKVALICSILNINKLNRMNVLHALGSRQT
jgi:hypothetical protein